MQQQIFWYVAVKASKMAVVFGECCRECLSAPGNTGRGRLVLCFVAAGTHSYWETGSVCQQYWIHFTQTKCYQEYWSFQGHYLIKALPAYCSGILRMWLWGRRPSWMGMYIYLFACCIFSLSGQCLIFIYLLCLLCTYRELWRIRRLNLTAFLLR
jgi:hypothetical protein